MKIRYSVVRTVVITAMAVFGIAVIVTLYAVAPTLHRIAKTRTQDYLRERFKSSVQFKDFDVTVYPRIHVVIHELEMRHQGRTDIPPLIDVTAIHLYANFSSLFSHHPVISHVVLVGLQINTPPRHPGGPPMIKGSNVDLSKKFPVTLASITADQATITILRTDMKPPKQFEIHQLELKNFDFTNPAPFHALLTNPVPRGEINCEGQFGPWVADDPSQTPVAANYIFANADMGTLKGLKGTLTSEGHFAGPLDYLNVEGKTDIPDFALRTSDHPVALHTDYKAVVDGTNGNTYLKLVTAHFGHSTLVTKGEVVDEYKKVKGRTIVMDTVANSARIEDLLFLAVKSNPPVMTGSAKLKANILIPEGPQDLLDRLRIDGEFGVADAEFSSDSVQGKVDSLSRRAQGHPKDMDLTAVSELKAAFKMDNSNIKFTRLNFSVPGAYISLLGDYNVDSGQLDFHGNLNMHAKLSQTVTGVKSFFLKAVDPFFKGKNGYGSTLPIKVTGTKDHPSFGLDRHHDKADKPDKNEKAEKADKGGDKDQALKTDDPKSAKTARE
jgi:hypothetical protein